MERFQHFANWQYVQGVGVVRDIRDSVRWLPETQAALEYARELHAGQLRDADGAPFFLHPREVASLLSDAGAPDHLVAAGALHDVIEKTPAVEADLRRHFGSRITALVLSVTEDERIAAYEARKAALGAQVARAGDEALMLFAADKISKARELRLGGEGVDTSRRQSARKVRSRSRRLAHYRRCLALLQERVPDSSLVAQLDAELERLSDRAHAQPLAAGTA
jgi:(p)ppGpp synthase/HD superfamily hydrolase